MRLAEMSHSDRKTAKKLLKRMVMEFQTPSPNRAPRHYMDHCDVDRNAWARGILDKYARDGRIGIIRSGMDCDCTQYYAESVMNVDGTVAGFVRWYDGHYQSLDGPESMQFTTPDRIKPVYRSRDRALEAYEDGHPHVVRYTPGDDLSSEY